MKSIFTLGTIAMITLSTAFAVAGSGPGTQSDSACGLADAVNGGAVTVGGTSSCHWGDPAARLASCDVTIVGTVLATNWITPGSVSAYVHGYKCYDSQSTSWLAVSGIINF